MIRFPWRSQGARRHGNPTITATTDLEALALRNAAMDTPVETRTENVVAVLLDQALEEMSHRFREDRTVSEAARTVAQSQARLEGLHNDHTTLPATGPATDLHHSPTGTAVDTESIAAEVEHALTVREQERVRSEIARAEQEQQAAEQAVVDALVTIAQRARTTANRYLAALNQARSDLGRQTLPLLGDDTVDELFTRAVRQPRQHEEAVMTEREVNRDD